jgi:tellurite resistance protein
MFTLSLVTDPIAAATAAIEIDRPVEVVRAAFFDLDHAIRDKIHHGVELRWLPPAAPGELRFEQETKALGRTQHDELLLEVGEGGARVFRFVGGPNAGARLVATFAPSEHHASSGPARTRVVLTAFTGPSGYQTGVGKLSQLGLEKMLQKKLEENRRALEGYQPGRARGAVRSVLVPLRDAVLAARSQLAGDTFAVMTNLLEAACVVAIADGQVDEAERDVIQEVARTLCFVELPEAAVDALVESVAAAVAAEGVERRCEKIASRLASLDLGEVGLGVAALVADVSHGVGTEEYAALAKLAEALGLGEGILAERIRGIDRVLSGG